MERMKCVVVACAAAVGLAAGAFADTINLATVTKPTVAKNGDVIKGTMVGGKKITIAKGAKVTLKDVKINDKFDYADAGLYAGSATIILEGENRIVASDSPDGTGNVAEYPLAVDDPDGITIIAEEYNPNRFFRIRVDVAP